MVQAFVVHPLQDSGPRPAVFVPSDRLSERTGVSIVFVVESLQRTGSFKFRAAFNVAEKVREGHLLTASSGNFGQALACAARLTGKRCTVVMPATASRVKIEAVRSYGADVELIDVTRISRDERIAQIRERHPEMYFASPFDDELVVEGNSTLGVEIAKAGFPCDAVLAPIGGGGLTSGLVRGLAAAGSLARVVACEPLMANDFARSLRAGEPVSNDGEPPTLADGARTRQVGRLNWAILRSSVTEAIEVREETLRESVRQLFGENIKSEPTGGLALGGLLEDPARFAGQTVCCVVSGGNVDPALYSELIQE